jgi:hypothetical protein
LKRLEQFILASLDREHTDKTIGSFVWMAKDTNDTVSYSFKSYSSEHLSSSIVNGSSLAGSVKAHGGKFSQCLYSQSVPEQVIERQSQHPTKTRKNHLVHTQSIGLPEVIPVQVKAELAAARFAA